MIAIRVVKNDCYLTRSSNNAEGPHEAPHQLKSCHLSSGEQL